MRWRPEFCQITASSGGSLTETVVLARFFRVLLILPIAGSTAAN